MQYVYIKSHPVWVRGLKHAIICFLLILVLVAPRVGAWIETLLALIPIEQGKVAPRVGAWIETQRYATYDGIQASHPVWVRGLKHRLRGKTERKQISRTPCGCVD